MTPREKFILALQGHQPPGRVPHFELVFYLTMEAFNRVHPLHRHFAQWDQMSPAERNLHIRDIAYLKHLVDDQVCLIGNVNCGLMDTGSDAQVTEPARYALRRYQLILYTWRNEGNYS